MPSADELLMRSQSMTQGAPSLAPVVLLGRLFFALIFVMACPDHFSSQTIAYAASRGVREWTKMQERLQAAESEIQKRQHVLSMDHGGTPEERQAIANALNGMKILRTEVAEWQAQQPADAATTPD